MTDISTARHQSIFDPSVNNPPIHIIGCGATGSRVWMALVELGLTNIHAYDFDIVEPHNLANQIFLAEDIGRPKVSGLARMYTRKTGEAPPESMKFYNGRVTSELFARRHFAGIVFLLVDSMAARREIYDSLLAVRDPTQQCFLLIETRMASSYGNVFTFNPFDTEESQAWQDSLVDDDAETTELSPCGTTISVGPTANIIANMAVWQMINFLTDELATSPVLNIFCKPAMLAQDKLVA